VLAVAHGPLRRSVDAARPFACGLSAVLATGAVFAAAVAPSSALAADAPARVFEQVTPVHKYSSDVNAAQTAAADGNAIAYNTFGGMENGPALFQSTFVARRGDNGWTSQGFTAVPPVAAPNLESLYTALEPSADLGTFYTLAPGSMPAAGPDDQNSGADVLAVHPGGSWDLLSKPDGVPATGNGDAYYSGRSDDGRHVIFATTRPMGALPAPSGTEVYDVTGGHVVLVSVDADGNVIGNAQVGARTPNTGSVPAPDRTAISTDGSHIVFSTATAVYVRVDGTTTIQVSASQKTGSVGTPATGATFMGAAQNGSRIIFASTDQLTDNAPSGGGIYAFDVASRTLTLIASVPGTTPHIVKISPDGNRVYFLASTVLVPGKGTANGNNIYVADDGSGVRYVATIDTASALKLWNAGESLSTGVVSPDGTRLAFGTTANVTGYASGGKSEVYVYSDESHRVTCASCPAAGTAATGNASIQDNSQAYANPGQYTPRGFANDNRLFFNTPQALVDGDTNGVSDVYVADADGTRHLISTGTDPNPSFYEDNSADGRDVFLLTRGALVSTDDDGGVYDLYDARVGGRTVPAAPPSCTGDGCKPPVTAPPAAPSIASASATDTSTAAPAPADAAPTTFKVSAISASARSAWARTGTLSLKVRVSDAAEVRVSGRGAVGRKTVTVASGRALRTAAGTVTVKVRLTSAARAALRRSGRLTVRLTVSSTGTSKTAHATAALRASRKASR
jgi:hypothetical protein